MSHCDSWMVEWVTEPSKAVHWACIFWKRPGCEAERSFDSVGSLSRSKSNGPLRTVPTSLLHCPTLGLCRYLMLLLMMAPKLNTSGLASGLGKIRVFSNV